MSMNTEHKYYMEMKIVRRDMPENTFAKFTSYQITLYYKRIKRMPFLLVSYAVRVMFVGKLVQPSLCYGCNKTHPISVRVLLHPREHIRCYVGK